MNNISKFMIVTAGSEQEELIFWMKLRASKKRLLVKARKRERSIQRQRQYAIDTMEALSNKMFKLQYRMSRLSFNHLLAKLYHKLDISERGKVNARNGSGSYVEPSIKLAVTLRWLAGGSHLDICFGYGISTSTFYNSQNGILWKTLEYISESMHITFPVSNTEALNKIEQGFAAHSFGRLRGCVMAVDGWVVKTRQPYKSEVENINCFRNRKECFGLVVIGGVDSECRFNLLSVKSPGSTNDCIAWEFTNHYTDIHCRKLLPPNMFYIGDEGFVNTDSFLTPISGNRLNPAEDGFNYHLSRMRQNVERSFGIMVRKWGIFWRPLSCAYDRWHLVITCCAKLHNYCIDRRIEERETEVFNEMPFASDVQVNDDISILTDDAGIWRPTDAGEDVPNGTARSLFSDTRRRAFVGMFHENGWVRPTYNTN